MSNKKPVSFEFFPPKTAQGVEKLLKVRDALRAADPAFFSVTYGAGGSTRDRTMDTVMAVGETGVCTAPHLSCVGDTKASIETLLTTYQEKGIKRIVALRGDAPSGAVALGELRYANELVAFIREKTGDHFKIEVAAYPEMHPQAPDFEQDLINFRKKVDAGADSAITQYFYSADAYFYFVERVHALGVTVPIYPGIMPITNYSNLVRFSDMCGAEIPRWIRKQCEAYADDIESIKRFGADAVSTLCEQLLKGGAPGFHFYTMNQSEPSLAICRRLGLID